LRIEPQRYVFEPLSKLAGGNDRRDELARLWAELLGIDSAQIQAGDNFFDLGGNSLLAMRAVSDAERLFGLKVDPGRYVYETLQQLSVPTTDTAAAAAAAVPAVQTPQPRSMLSRVLSRFGRRS
jgi:acyl carrier protein